MIMTKPDAVEFSVSYEGEAVAESTMDVRDLAPALLALGQAFDRANSLLNSDRASVTLEIRATRQGSFEILLILKQLFDGASTFLSHDFISSAANIKNLLLGGKGLVGLLKLKKMLKGSKPKEIERTENNVTLEIEHLRLSVPAKVLDLYKDRILGEQIEAVVRPLTRDGIDRIVFRDQATLVEMVEKDEAEYFQPDQEEGEILSEIVIPRQRLKIVSLNFLKGKWRLSDGERARWYTIRDHQFAREVEQGIRRFGNGDLLICQVVMTQRIDAEGNLKLDHVIADVLKHEQHGEQLRMIDNS